MWTATEGIESSTYDKFGMATKTLLARNPDQQNQVNAKKLGAKVMSRSLPSLIVVALLVGAPAAAQEHTITITGPAELYLSHDTMSCGPHARGSGRDTTDIPVSAFRRADGSVIVLAGNQSNYYLEGSSIDDAKRTSCQSIVEPVNDSDPATFRNRRWVFGIYAKSYDFVLAFIHNEYHGFDFPKWGEACRITSHANRECWYGSTGLALSKDGGRSFTTPAVPDNVLAALPFRFKPGALRAGMATPKVVGNPRDGMVYVLVNHFDRNRRIRAGQCLLRGSGKEFNDWRAWDGKGFNIDPESPYVKDPSGADCTHVIPYIVQSVRYIPRLDLFVSIGHVKQDVIYSFSKDLIAWSTPKVLMNFVLHQRWQPGMHPPREYFTLLDGTSSSINFDTIEGKPYLYFVQVQVKDGRLNRRRTDVYRMPVSIQ